MYLGRVAEMLRVLSPAPAVGSGGQYMYVDYMALSDHHSLMAPAEFDGICTVKLHKAIGCVEGTLKLTGLNANCCYGE